MRAADRRPGVEQRDRPAALLPRKPLGHGLGRAGPVGRLAEAEQEAEGREAAEAGRQRRQHRGHRVEGHADRQARARAEAIEQAARQRLPAGIGDAERDDQHREVGVAPLELGLDVRRQHRQRLAVDVVDDGGKKQQPADVPAQPHARPSSDADSRSRNSVVSACVCRIEAGTRRRDRAVHRRGARPRPCAGPARCTGCGGWRESGSPTSRSRASAPRRATGTSPRPPAAAGRPRRARRPGRARGCRSRPAGR